MNDERPLAEALRESEERLRTAVAAMAELEQKAKRLEETTTRLTRALEGSNDGFYDWHVPSGLVEHNGRLAEILGEEPSTLPGHIRALKKRIHPDDRSRVVAAATAYLSGATPFYECEHRLRHRSGRWVWCLVRARVVERDEGGAPLHATGTISDITARKVAEERLHEREESLRQVLREKEVILENAGIGIALTIDCTVVWMNRRLEEISLYSRDELVGRSMRALYPSEEAFVAGGQAVAAALGAGKAFDAEVLLQRKDGSTAWAGVHGTAVDATDPAKGTLWIIADRTAGRQAQAELQRERQRYMSLMKIAQDGIHLLDETGALVEANEAFLRMLGRGAEEIGHLHLRDWDSVLPESKIVAGLRRLMRRPCLFETEHHRADGSVFDVEIHAGGVELEGRRYLLAASRDITARKEMERQLARKQEQLEELNSSLERRVKEAVSELREKDQLLITQGRQAAMGEMIGNIAHQWRQPLNALGLVLSNLRDASRFGDLDAEGVEQAVADGNRLVQKMSSTINDFRDFFRPEKERHAFSALAQIRETVGLLDASFRNDGIALEIEAPADVVLFGYSNEYSQVLLNLLANAKQAITASKIAAGRVSVRLEVRGGLGCLTVRDNGGGIPEAILDKIFEPYFSTKESGSGIGLYMSRQIVERSLGGRLTARNVDGGAEMTVLSALA